MRRISLIVTAALAALTASAGTRWVSADSLPLLGKCVDPTSTSYRYQRIPDSLEHKVKRPDLFRLGRNSAGMAIRFATDAPAISLKWKSTQRNLMNHMTPTGTRGLDLYTLLPDSTWTFVQSGRPDPTKAVTETCVIKNMTPEQREYMLYLSLYDGVDSLFIGVPDGYTISVPAVPLPRAEKPIIYYGTSLTQGGCANRPGMVHTNIIGRRLNRDVVNLGFSGNGQLDLEIADVMAAVHDPALYVLDFLPNVNNQQLDTLFIPFVDILRNAHPTVPILVIEDPDYPYKRFDCTAQARVESRRELLKQIMDRLLAADPNVYFLPSPGLIGDDGEPSVDGLHFTDIGFTRYADNILPTIIQILNPNE
ncbi:MAG: hydrolase [Bacteroidales bacterium]|nr:hydrolase [Bacteroidales bacterium]